MNPQVNLWIQSNNAIEMYNDLGEIVVETSRQLVSIEFGVIEVDVTELPYGLYSISL